MQDFIVTVKKLWEEKEKLDELKRVESVQSKVVEGLKIEVLKTMEASELDKQHVPGCGTVYRQRDFSVKVPKEIEAKLSLFEWIRDNKGEETLDAMVSINSQSLNSFYKAELALAKERGDVDFALPGIQVPEVYYKIGMRRG